ncbi:MAG: cardiolipin synthase [Firmicutes bacterium]|nr:cardiolipin synthase [Bacillota bacterium]MCM1400738.1 cardiolipin synthase [Bacteroides sp.]MCM1476843.1 cardiolipin synthase [Bacteroides sp.]
MIILSWVYWLLMIAYAITVISIVGVVLSENRNPVKSLAWITVLLLFPVGGLVLYLFFGRSIKNTHMISRRNRRKLRQPQMLVDSTIPADFTPELHQLIELGRSLSGAMFYPDNEADVFHHGDEKFKALLADIAKARHYIHLQYYIIEDDRVGNQLREALIEKAQQGVKVRVIYDDFGCWGVKRDFFKSMQNAGIDIHPFFKVAFPPFATRINWRNHRKLAIIDGRIGYIGGMNVADRYIDGGKNFGCWRDTHMRVIGPAVAAIEYSFAVDWSFMGQDLLEVPVDISVPQNIGEPAGMQMLRCGPTNEWSDISLYMLKAIGNAKKRVYIQTPYFLPPDAMLNALQAAALARVDVRVMMPLKSDSFTLTYASYSYIMECLRAGIKIYLFEAGMLHSKTMIIDDRLCAIGSANIDFRSFEHNFEDTMFIFSHKINANLRHQFMEDLKNCRRVRPSQWRRRPLIQKAKESIVRLLSPVL